MLHTALFVLWLCLFFWAVKRSGWTLAGVALSALGYLIIVWGL